jgi:hypothetical protein
MNFVTQLPNGVKCISSKSDELPEGSTTFGEASEYYDAAGKLLKAFRNLPKFNPKLLKLGPLADDV